MTKYLFIRQVNIRLLRNSVTEQYQVLLILYTEKIELEVGISLAGSTTTTTVLVTIVLNLSPALRTLYAVLCKVLPISVFCLW